MAQTMRNAFANGDSTEVIQRRSAEQRTTTKLAYSESSRQKRLSSRKALNTPLKPDEVYTGADLKSRPR